MNIRRKATLLAAMVLALLALSSLSSHAASGLEGYAIHRDGAFFGTTWHAGIMDEAHQKINLPVTHAGPNLLDTITYASWADFIDGNNFAGYYLPKTAIDSAGRTKVRNLARKLVAETILYTPVQQINYSASSSVVWIEPEHITSMRCDGLVEYCYEYYTYRIFGSNSQWDISRNGNQLEHALAAITPKSQAQTFMNIWPIVGTNINLINAKSGKGLDVCNGSAANGTYLQQWDVTGGGGANQQFKITASGDFYALHPTHAPGSAVEIVNCSSANNALVQIWAKPSSGYMNSQKFKFVMTSNGSISIRSYASSYTKAISVLGGSTANGASIVQLDASNSLERLWWLVPSP